MINCINNLSGKVLNKDQIYFLKIIDSFNNIVCLKPRQIGITLALCLYSVYESVYNNKIVLFCCMNHRCKEGIDYLIKHIKSTINLDDLFSTGSINTVSVPGGGSVIRGRSADILICDEISHFNRVQPNPKSSQAQYFLSEILPVVKETNGKIILTGSKTEMEQLIPDLYTTNNKFFPLNLE